MTRDIRNRSSKAKVAVVLFSALMSALISFELAYRFYLDIETERAVAAVQQSATNLEHILGQHSPLVFAVSIDQRSRDAMKSSDTETVSRWLKQLSEKAELETLYLMDVNGQTVAASNFDEEGSFVGQNYGFRPYFSEALAGKLGTFFAIGVTTGNPGYFLSLPIEEGGRVIGVVTAKVGVSDFETLWNGEFLDGFITTEDDVVILTSNTDWLYKSVSSLSNSQLQLIKMKRQFADHKITTLPAQFSDGFAQMSGREWIHLSYPLVQTGWTLHTLRPTALAQSKATLAAFIVTSVALGLISLFLAFRTKRVRQQLFLSEQTRNELVSVNNLLASEINERIQAQTALAKAQSRLVQTGRMAALGQLSASVIHELGQPLSMLKNYLVAAEINAKSDTDKVLISQLHAVSDRMQSTTDELRNFSRPDVTSTEEVDLVKVILSALQLTQNITNKLGVKIKLILPKSALIEEGRSQRLEQVVINLITNACRAISSVDQPAIEIELLMIEENWQLRVSDNGLGFGGKDPKVLFEAFYTTSTKGNGLGLGLAISAAIVSEHHGKIWANESESGGAQFYVELPQKA